MQEVTFEKLAQIAVTCRERLWEKAQSAELDSPKIILHWTAGWWEQTSDHYHINITGDGRIFMPSWDIATKRDHTWKRNTGTVGIALCCAAEATTNDLGENPPTAKQIERMAKIVAILCKNMEISLTSDNVLTHGEAADNPYLYDDEDLYGPQNPCEDMRWDLQFLGTPESPEYITDHENPMTGGNVIRGKAIWYLEHLDD